MRPSRRLCYLLIPLLLFLVVSRGDLSAQAQSGKAEYEAAMKNGAEMMQQAKYEDAVVAFRNAIQLSGEKQYEPFAALADAYNFLHDKLNALESAERMLALAPSDAVRAQAYDLEGVALSAAGRSDKPSLSLAETQLRTAEKLDPTNADVHFHLGRALMLEDHEEEGVVELKVYLTAAPRGAHAQDARELLGGADIQAASDALEGEFSADPSNGADDGAPPIKPPTGQPAPKFVFKTVQGTKVSSDDLHGKVVLLDFWATWCPACRAAFPSLEELYGDLDKSKVAVVSISVDANESAWRNFLNVNNPSWTQTRDADHKLRRAFVTPLYGIPSYILIDGDGIVRDRFTGWSPRIGNRIEADIGRWSKSPAAATTGAVANRNGNFDMTDSLFPQTK